MTIVRGAFLAMLIPAALLLSACGVSVPVEPSPSPISNNRVAGLEAVQISANQFPQATGLLRVTVSFPRPGGTAEFWSVTLRGPDETRTIEIQERRVVGDRTLLEGDPSSEGTSVKLDVLGFDTSAAEAKLQALPRVKDKGRSVSLSPIAMDPTRTDVPTGALGAPAWEFLIIENRDGAAIQVETIWVSAVNGELLAIR